MTIRGRLFHGIVLVALLGVIALLTTREAAPQQHAARQGLLIEALYSPAGVGALGSSASVAWFIATPKSGDPYPVACRFVAESIVCKKGTFE